MRHVTAGLLDGRFGNIVILFLLFLDRLPPSSRSCGRCMPAVGKSVSRTEVETASGLIIVFSSAVMAVERKGRLMLQ
jgi:hypothetical protein